MKTIGPVSFDLVGVKPCMWFNMFESISKIQDPQPRGWFFSQQLAVCTLCKPNQSCPWFQTKSAWCLLASPPPKKCPPAPLSSQNDCHKGREAAPFPSSAAFLPPHLCGRRGGMLFLQLEEDPMGKEEGDGGRNFFWEKLHSRGLRQEQRENYSSTESQSQYEKRSFLP